LSGGGVMGDFYGARLRQVEEVVFVDRRLDRRALFEEVGDQLPERLRVHHRAREDVRADRRALLDDGYLNVAERPALPRALPDRLVVLGDEAREVQRAAQRRRPRADEEDVHLYAFTFHHSRSSVPPREGGTCKSSGQYKMNDHSVNHHSV
jgi:hypothetical protein